jgi:cytochrome c oxidase subunit 3
MEAMGHIVQYRPRKAREEATASIGMVIFLGAWAMMFASIFFAYAFIRIRAPSWPPPGLPPLPWKLPLFSTLAIAASSVALSHGLAEIRRGAQSTTLAKWIGISLLLGAAFIALQLVLWSTLHAQGLTTTSGGPYTSVFYGLTWLHAIHVAGGVLGLLAMGFRASRGEFRSAHHLPVRLWAMYWHFVAIVWLVMFVTVFLI